MATNAGYMTDEAQVSGQGYNRKPIYSLTTSTDYGTKSGSGIGMTTDEFLGRKIGGEKMGAYSGGSTIGSYGYAVKSLSEGLANAVDRGWITDEEAKVEMRQNVSSVASADEQARYMADRIEAIEEELKDLREKQAGKKS